MADTARIEELRRRVQTDPASIAFAALAEEYRRAGHFDDAIATCRTGLQRHPAYLSARVTLGRSLLEIGRYDEARQELEQVLRSAPENLAAIRALAEIHHRAGELPESEHHFQETDAQPAADEPVAAPQAPPVATASGIPLSVVPAAPATPPSVADSATPIAKAIAPPIQQQAAVPLAPSATPVAAAPVTSSAPSPPIPAAPMIAAPLSRQESTRRTATSAAAVALSPAPVPRASHPDEVALPALEAFLSAIVAVRTSGSRVAR
jgi:tetratricopeptide (TPR) repeat protein